MRRRDLLRVLAVLLCIIGLILTSSALNLVGRVSAADGPKKAVIVAGPVHSLTARYKGYARAIADAAEAQGMEVVRIFHPYAPASKVRNKAQGADLFVYAGHGNGWPSDYGPFQEDTKNGLGLDAADPEKRSPDKVVYKGANWLRENIELAPNAVVILTHLSYASGNASSGMPIPSRDVAVQRVDNFANGFLSVGARVVWALGWQPGADIVKALHEEDATMDAVFMTRYREDVNPLNGWIGWQPGYYDSVRIPGATVHIDPDPDYGYLRGITGDLGFTTTEWRDADTAPADVVAPVVSNVTARQAVSTISSSAVPVFTPNGDGISDSIAISYKLSEGAFLEVRVKRDGGLVRRWSTWAQQGAGTVAWDGRKDNGKYAGEGKFNVYLTATDRAGNSSEQRSTQVKVLSSIKSPTASPGLFWARDGDTLVAKSALRAKLTREATVSWVIRDRAGNVVRRGIDQEARAPGDVRFAWDGRDDTGAYVPDDRYTARISVKRPSGTYAHEVTLRHMPFMAWTRKWTRQRGDTITLKLTSAEPLKGKPVVTANQRGITKYAVPPRKITRLSSTQFKVVIKTRDKGKAGVMKVRVVGTDTDGGTNAKVFSIRLK
ncbi:MAG: FlgD immunoglobulin-like domain containing protein [Chloroflexota bacterium]